MDHADPFAGRILHEDGDHLRHRNQFVILGDAYICSIVDKFSCEHGPSCALVHAVDDPSHPVVDFRRTIGVPHSPDGVV
ncbi:hypothetical protein ACH0CP_10335 [Sphingomonas sp. 179-I 2A4 NHS]|uniref:hypothetical protein n=1 Tax=unclassified Sphingomonas TaxID=196159 RepID=UPI003879FA36